MENNKKIKKIIGLGMLVLLLIGSTYAYFVREEAESKSRDVRVLTSTVDSLVFEIGKELSITANQENFASGKGNRSDATTAKATLKANNYTNTATDHYYLYLDITSNSLKYTTTEKTAELILSVSRTDGTEVTIEGLTPVAVNGVTGYDITEARGTIKIADNYEISATNANTDNTKTDEWNITVTLINLDSNQNENAGAIFKGALRMRKEAPVESVLKAKSGTSSSNATHGIKSEEIVSRIVFESEKVEHPESASEYDFSASGDGSIKGYTVLNEDGKYTLYINSENKIMANPDSSYWFTAINGNSNAQYITSIEGLENLDISSVTDMSAIFYNCSGLETLDLNGWDTSKATNMRQMFSGCSSLTTLDLNNWDTSSVTNMYSMFYGCSSLTTLDLNNWDTSSVIDMSYMFRYCSSLTTLDLNGWNTSTVTDMSYMFEGCSNLTTLNISDWDTSSVTNMSYMFSWCSSLTTLYLNNLNTSSVTNMSYMFQNCSNLTNLNISNLDTSKVTNMSYMFKDCRNLTKLDLNNWDTSKVKSMYCMFNGSGLTTLDLNNWNTSNVTNMSYMFAYCNSLTTLNISNWDTSSVTNVDRMFYNSGKLTKLIVRDNSEKEKFTPLVGSKVTIETV